MSVYSSPVLRTLHGVLHADDGDKLEHRTAIAENRDDKFILLRYHPDGVTRIPMPDVAAQAA